MKGNIHKRQEDKKMKRSKNYSDVQVLKESTLKTGDKTLDNFISNDKGFVIGSAIFLTGTSGAGKTTFAFTLQKVLKDYVTSLYSREMSASAIKDQMKRYAIGHKNAYIADREMCPTINEYINELNELKPKVIIIDSLQVITKEDYPDMSEEAAAFNIIQLLRKWTEKNKAVLIMVGHVNKDGGFEGKNTIKHMFDAHLEMIFDKKTGERTISWSKNRKGPLGLLYYEFGKNRIEFFTPQEYEMKKNDKTFSDFLLDATINYINGFKNKPFYKEMSTQIKKGWDNIPVSNLSKFNTVMEMINIVKQTINKFI